MFLIRFGPPDPDQKHDFAVLGADVAGAKPWACPMVSRVVEHPPPTSHITYIAYLAYAITEKNCCMKFNTTQCALEGIELVKGKILGKHQGIQQ